MNKRVLLSLLLVISLLALTACGKSEVNISKDEKIVKVNEIELHMNKEKEFKGLKYTITDDLREVDMVQYMQYYQYQEAGPNLLYFRIFYYKGKDHKFIRNDLAIDNKLVEESGKTDNIEYSFIDTKRTDGIIHFYIIDKDGESFVINFVSQYDIKDFEKYILNSIKF